ncbi:MAG: hypothetical protein E6833_26785, partial [Bradyrhizobium sp.]|nr:hypothetical protein [Bradyrhizobium sp.]
RRVHAAGHGDDDPGVFGTAFEIETVEHGQVTAIAASGDVFPARERLACAVFADGWLPAISERGRLIGHGAGAMVF